MATDLNKFFFDLHERYFRVLVSPFNKIQDIAGNAQYLEALYFGGLMITGELVIGDAPLTKKIRETFLHCYKIDWRNAPNNLLSVLPELQAEYLNEQFNKQEERRKRKTVPAWIQKAVFKYLEFRVKIGFPITLKPVNLKIDYAEPLSGETDPRIILKYLVRWFTRKRLRELMEERFKLNKSKEKDPFENLVYPPLSTVLSETLVSISKSQPGDKQILEELQSMRQEFHWRFDNVDSMLIELLSQKETIQSILANLEADLISQAAQEQALNILQMGIEELSQKLSEQEARELKAITTKVNAEPELKGKLKMTIPIIPKLLVYEKELSWDWKKARIGLRGLVL